MKILVIGSGGREHALCWKLAQSEGVEVFACPGNPGMARVATCVPGDPLDAALRVGADLTVVGPEVPLVAGVVDAFRARGLRIVGPNAEAAQLEGSKIFAKDFFVQRGIPTAAYTTVENASHARMALGRFGFPVVLKADGLAAGKGVVVAHNAAEAEAALATLKGRLVIEEFLTGEEVSFIALCDGRDALPLAATPGPQSGLRRRPGSEHRRHGRVLRRGHPQRRGHADGDGPGDLSDRGSHELHRLSLCRPDDDGGRPQGAGVQRPARRPGDAAA